MTLVEQDGYRALTMERIAAEAGVGKQTLYRWWPSKAEIILAALNELADREIPLPDSGNGRDDVARFLTRTFSALKRGAGAKVRALMAESQLDPAFAPSFREQLIERRRAALRSLLRRAQERGELRDGANLELLLDVAYGVMWYRLLVEHAALSPAAARSIADAMFAIGAPPASRRTSRR